jgi:glycosyltransferase involved in cell wall biosynthesis
MISVFTPSHNSQYLTECYKSLKAQSYKDWEWIVYLNGGAKWPDPKDPRVKVIEMAESIGVGRAKADAVSFCEGDILVELDHDDLLTPKALDLIASEFHFHPDASMVYGKFRQINADGSDNHDIFNPDYGWHYEDGVPNNFPQVPSAVSYIWYAPNHPRAFTRAAYDAVGGYDANLDILDDQDLMCRLYQRGEFVEIPALIYKQRVHSEQTQVRQDKNARIQIETVGFYDRYIQGNALAWAKRNELWALDLGGAHNPADGFTTVDLHDADRQGDIFEVLAEFRDNSVGVIRAMDFLEHIPDKVRLMNECYRVLHHGGMLLSMTPSTDGRGAFQDPTHVSFWNENSWWYYTKAELAKYVPEIVCRFQVSRLATVFPSEWHRQNNISYVLANVVAIKDGPRLPGLLEI